MSKMVLELGGKYTAGDAFSKAQNDIKSFGKENRDAIKAGTDTLKELEKGFGEDLSKSVGAAKGVIQGLAQGGIWGAIGAAAGAAIGFIVDKFKEASENAKEFAVACGEYVTNGLKQIGEQFQQTKSNIEAAKTEIADFAQIAQGNMVASANAKIHQLHIETLQKITDNMSQTGRKVIEADEALAVAKIKQEEQHWTSIIKTEEQEKRIKAANETLAAAKDRLADVETQTANLGKEEWEAVWKYTVLKSEIESITQSYKDGLITEKEATERSAKKRAELNELLELHKGTIDGNNAALEEAKKAASDVAAAQRALDHEERVLTLVKQQNTEAERQAERAILDATQAKKLAEQADRDYNDKQKAAADKIQEAANMHYQKMRERIEAEEMAEAEAAELRRGRAEVEKECIRLGIDSARWLDIYTRTIREGAEHNEAMDTVRHAWEKATSDEAKITEVCTQYKVDAKEYIKKYNKMIDAGISETDAYAQLQRDLNEELKKRKDAEKEATDLTKEGNKNSKDQNGKDKKGMIVSLSTSNMGDLGEKVEEKMTFKDWQKKNRDEQRKARDSKNNMKIDQAKMTKALKGEMPKAEAEEWMKYAKQKYTPDQMRELGKLAMNKELLSKKEQQRQLKAVEQMAQEIAKSLTIK